MTPAPSNIPANSVTLTRQDIVDILILGMGWEDEDVVTFWCYARRENRNPGYLARTIRQDFLDTLASIERDMGGQQ